MLPGRSGHKDLPLYDVNGDGFLSPVDVLIVINAVNDGFVAPTIDVSLFQDTAAGGSNNDLLTANPNVVGELTQNNSSVTRLTAQVDGGARAAVDIETNGSFAFDTPLPLDGSEDGEHTLHFTAFQEEVILGTKEITFALDSVPPTATSQLTGVLRRSFSSFVLDFDDVMDATAFVGWG